MTASESNRASPRPIASPLHTVILIAILLAIAWAGYTQVHARGAGGELGTSGWPAYLGLLGAEFALFYFVSIGLRGRRVLLKDMISARGWSLSGLLLDALIGVALLAVWLAVEFAWDKLLGAPDAAAVRALQVHQAAYVPIWIALSLSAGFVEELTFRGYLQQQFAALTRSPLLGLLAQAILFGVTHGYQGVESVLRIAVFGVVFGVVALVRKSLRPGMLAHALVDILGGLPH